MTDVQHHIQHYWGKKKDQQQLARGVGMHTQDTRRFAGFSFLLPLLVFGACAEEEREHAPMSMGSLDESSPPDSMPTTVWTLDDGTEVSLPAYFRSTGGIMIVGTGNLDALSTLQRGANSYSPVNAAGRGICYVWLFDYSEETDLGSYQEVAFIHLAVGDGADTEFGIDTSRFESILMGASAVSDRTVLVNTALWVNSPLALTAGEQIWGLPKLGAEIEVASEYGSADAELRRTVTITENHSGVRVLFADLALPQQRLPGRSFPPQQAITTGAWGRQGAGPQRFDTAIENVESMALLPWDPSSSRFEIGSGTAQLDMLRDVDFTPMGLVSYGPFELDVGAPTMLSEGNDNQP